MGLVAGCPTSGGALGCALGGVARCAHALEVGRRVVIAGGDVVDLRRGAPAARLACRVAAQDAAAQACPASG